MKLVWFIFLITLVLVLIKSQDMDSDSESKETTTADLGLLIGHFRRMQDPAIKTYFRNMEDTRKNCIGKVANANNEEEVDMLLDLIKTYNDLKWVDDLKLRRYMACLFEEVNAIDMHGRLDFNVYLDSFKNAHHKRLIKRMLDHCVTSQRFHVAAESDKAYIFNECILMFDPRHYVLP